MTHDFCVGTYLTTRLQQLGITHIFSVPGDYTSELLGIIDEKSELRRIGNCNELNAGYAADGYARFHGIGAVAVTSGVGAFSLLNAVAGSFAEHIPVVVIIGTLSTQSRLLEVNAGRRFHHQVSTADKNQEIYRHVTAAQEKIDDPLRAPEQIDAALRVCISQRLPVLIEITEDVYRLPCAKPHGALQSIEPYTSYKDLKAQVSANKHAAQIIAAIDGASAAVVQKFVDAKNPVLWFGHEIGIYGLRAQAHRLLELTGAPYVTSLLGKSVLSEATSGFAGVYEGVFITATTSSVIQASDALLAFGVWNTDINTLGTDAKEPGNPAAVFASRDVVKIGLDLYVQVSLKNLLERVIAQLEAKARAPRKLSLPAKGPNHEPVATAPTTYDGFFAALSRFITPEHVVVADIGISANGASAWLPIARENGYAIQGLWASIGWSVPAGLGASCGAQGRTIVIVGDGAFKLTCQEVATMVHCGSNAVVFVMNNGVYAVEQMFLDPKPFDAHKNAPFEAANILQRWDYVSLMRGFSNGDEARARAASVRTMAQLHEVLREIARHRECVWLVDVYLSERDYPSAWSAIVHP